jgi:hypothetical protein
MHGQGIPPGNASFRILVKKVQVPTRWEAGFLRRQEAQPWTEAGVVTWKNGVFQASIKNVEAL